MSQRKARLRRKATVRSRTNTKRLQRKGAAVILDAAQVKVEKQLGEARAERDKAFFEANETWRKGVETLTNERAEARRTASTAWEKKRDQILKDFAAGEEQAA